MFRCVRVIVGNRLLNSVNLQKFKHNLILPVSVRQFQTGQRSLAKVFYDQENTFAFNVVESSFKIADTPDAKISTVTPVTTLDEFNALMSINWRKKAAAEIVTAFKSVANFCSLNNINVEDRRFNRLTDGLMDCAEKLEDQHIFDLLDTLELIPPCESFKSHNFHDIWSALDDVCCWRISNWDTKTLFSVADKWHRLSLGRICDFIYDTLEKLAKRPTKLTKDELVHAFFFLNICRKKAIDFEYEDALDKKIDEMSLDEIAVVALGYFKTQSKVKIPRILSVMMNTAKKHPNPHEISLCAVLKIIRYTSNPSLNAEMYNFLEDIQPKLQSASILCKLHAALLGTTIQVEHRPTIALAAQSIAENATDVSIVRLKDMERILIPLTMFNKNPGTNPDVFEVIFKELHEERRREEIAKYPRCLGSALLYLAIRNLYSEELLDKVLDQEYVTEIYGKTSKNLPREIFTLDVSVEIERPDYKGNRLNQQLRRKAAKWLTSYSPTRDQRKRISTAEKLILDVTDNIYEIVGKENVLIEHVLPHYPRADLILCRDKKTGKYVKPFGFENYVLGDVMRPSGLDKFEWIAVVVIGWNNTIRNTTTPVGIVEMKFRHLEKIGFKPAPIIWNEYFQLTEEQKKNYILYKL